MLGSDIQTYIYAVHRYYQEVSLLDIINILKEYLKFNLVFYQILDLAFQRKFSSERQMVDLIEYSEENFLRSSLP